MTSKNIRRATAEDVPVLTQIRNDAHAKKVAHLGAWGNGRLVATQIRRQNEACQTQCDETYVALSNAAGMAKLSRIRFVSAAGVKPKSRLNSLLNWDALV
jgi:hypothetical protein